MTHYRITRDGQPVTGRVHASEMSAVGELLRVQPMSTDWAIRHEGYGIEDVTGDVDVWSADKAYELSATARRMFRDHGHEGYDDDETRSACGACALEGFGASDEEGALSPNYAGWARIYVQARRMVPGEWREGFALELADENRAYAEALAKDVRTFGVKFGSVR